ncbi:hypothetical protein BGZ97_006498 [Linnemannia gamsii]|uniref:Uncharacterized protein n=1 Tax=Linnemannia gamsii TaxID=64522 RepID=A0A9P6QQU4_9FUNG|nr:hypothetical protein BGZ97_006498 [Linnemannia gamsii]
MSSQLLVSYAGRFFLGGLMLRTDSVWVFLGAGFVMYLAILQAGRAVTAVPARIFLVAEECDVTTGVAETPRCPV